jgi:hypothetical protein
MNKNLRNVVFTTMIAMCTFQIGVIFKQNQVNQINEWRESIVESYILRTDNGTMLGYNINILDDERLFTYEN